MRPALLPLLLAPAFLSACANPGVPEASALGYTVQGSQQVQAVQFGTALAIQPVLIAPGSTAIGTLGGAAAGGYLGSRVGNGRGSTAMAIIGAVAAASPEAPLRALRLASRDCKSRYAWTTDRPWRSRRPPMCNLLSASALRSSATSTGARPVCCLPVKGFAPGVPWSRHIRITHSRRV